MGYVYLLLEVDREGNEAYKIGITKNEPDDRNAGLQTGNSNKISVLKYYESQHYKKVEKMLHKKFHNKKSEANNEWFILSNEDVLGFIDECKKADELICFLIENNPFYS